MNDKDMTNAADDYHTSTSDSGKNSAVGTNNSSCAPNDGENQYLKQERMIEEIAEQVKQQQSLTSALLPVSCLRQQYAGNTNFLIGISSLEKLYSHIRTIRGDGNCYYRAFLYRLLERLVTPQSDMNQEGQRLLHYITTKSWEDILQQKYDEVAIEIFHDEMIELFDDVITKGIYTKKDTTGSSSSSNDHTSGETAATTLFHNRMNEENSVSDFCTWYLRLITATYMKQDPDRFLPFVLSIALNHHDDNETSTMMICDIHQFCSKYIEPMGQECEHVQVLALAEAFQINVTVVYLDGHPSPPGSNDDATASQLQHHQFGPETSPIRLTLLYRPGHYDILYEK